MHENTGSKSGVPTIMQTAVLLERGTSTSNPLGQTFSVQLEIQGEVNRMTEAKEMLKNLRKRISSTNTNRKGPDKIFDLKINQMGKIRDQYNLKAERLADFQALLTSEEPTGSKKSSEPEKAPEPKQQAPQQAPQQVQKLPYELPQPTRTVRSSRQSALPEQLISSSPIPTSQSLGDISKTSAAIPKQPVPRQDSTSTKASSSSKGTRIAKLRDRIATIQIEANLVRRLLRLEKEEREVLQEIVQLEFAL
jgi:hypothetical protein